MKKALILFALIITSALASFAQSVDGPFVERSDNPAIVIKKIATMGQYTIVSFEYTPGSPNAWIQLNKSIYIQTKSDSKHFNYEKSEGIAIYPKKTILPLNSTKLLFKVYFRRIPAKTKTIDIIERADGSSKGGSLFNFYNVSLTAKEVLLPPAPPAP